MRPLTKRLTIGLFAALLLAPTLSALLPVAPSEIENRRIVRPDVSLDRLVEPGFYAEVLRYVRDANPMRTWLIAAGSGLDYWVFGDSPDPLRVLRGEDEWLFARDEIEAGCSAPPETVAANLVALIEQLREDVPTVVFTVTPSKFVLYDHLLTPDQIELTDCAREASEQLRELLASEAVPGYLDGWEMFETMQASGEQPYFRTDTHFNYSGSVPWMKSLVTEAGGVWEPGALVDNGMVKRDGNLMTLLGLSISETVHQVLVDRDQPRTPAEQLHQRFGEDYRATQIYLARSVADPGLITGQTVMLKDSFVDLPAPSLVQYFADITLTDWRDEESITYFLDSAREAEIVILETSEEGVWSRFADQSLLEEYLSGD